jgi:hypothetical protein
MVIVVWMVIGSTVVSTAIALLGCKRPKITSSEIAENLERPRDGDVAGDILDYRLGVVPGSSDLEAYAGRENSQQKEAPGHGRSK